MLRLLPRQSRFLQVIQQPQMISFSLYSNKKLRLAFELGLTIADTCKQHNIEVTPDLIKKAEEVLVKEFTRSNPTKLSVDFIPILLSILESKLDS